MTGSAPGATEHALAEWQDPAFVASWVRADAGRDWLAFPRALTAALVESAGAPPAKILDVASGAGAFLAVLLEAFPAARGWWCDVSEAMETHARAALGPLARRTSFVRADMRDLSPLGPEANFDLVVSSRAAHHLDDDELVAFYRGCATRCAPGGWVANLDHVGVPPAWAPRFRAARDALVGPSAPQSAHGHREPLASLAVHLEAAHAAGLSEVTVAWQALASALVVGRAPETGVDPTSKETP